MTWKSNWKKNWTTTFKTGFMPGGGAVVPSFGLQAWYDTSSDQYLTLATNAITQALDRSGSGNNTAVQGTGTARPTRATNQLNGIQLATFDGGDYLVLPSGLFSIPNGPNTIFAVAKNVNDGNERRIITLGAGGSTRFVLGFDAASNTVNFASKNAALTPLQLTGVTTTNYNLFTAFRSGTTQSLSAQGGTPVTNSSGADAAGIDGGTIGSNAGGTTTFLSGGIAEIIIYNRALSASEILNVEIYLANKWGLYHPNANWIQAYSAWQQVLIHAWKINKDDAFTNTTANPFAAIWDPSLAALGSTTSLADTGRGVNTATEATNPPVNTANAIGTANGLLYNATSTLLTAAAAASINNIFDAEGCFIGVIKPTTIGQGGSATDGGRVFDKGSVTLRTNDNSGSNCRMRFVRIFDTTPGQWQNTNRDLTLSAANIVAITYNASSSSNNPTFYVNSLTSKAVTTSVAPVGTASSDAGSNMVLGNNASVTRTFDGYIGKFLFLKSVPTTAQLTAVFNYLATEYGVTLT